MDIGLTMYFAGWGSPFIFATLWTIISVRWVRRDLRREKELWREEHAKSRDRPGDLAVEQRI
jgi:hypothetical protein